MIKKFVRLALNELCKIDFLRRRSNFLSSWYELKIIPYPQRAEFLGGHPSRILKNIKSKFFVWQSAPAYFSGGVVLNLLGFHVVRHIFHNKLSSRQQVSPNFSDLEENGVKAVKAMLSIEDVNYIRSFYEKNLNHSIVYLPDFSELVIYSNTGSVSNENYTIPEFKNMRKFLIEKLNLDKLFSELSGKELKGSPFMSIIHHKSLIDQNYVAQIDGNNIPHRDVFYPSYKIFIYLNDVSEENAAFVYYPNTHSAKGVSLKDVYLQSLRYYFHEKKALKPVNALESLGRTVHPVSQVGLAGTGIIFNVAGIHQRGDYKKDQFRERLVLLIDFRQNEALVIPKEHRWQNDAR